METVLKDYLLEGKEKQLGKVLSYGDLCGRLERLNCIDEVKYLQITFGYPTNPGRYSGITLT